MRHLTEEQLVAQYYRDGDIGDAAGHLAICAECSAAMESLRRVLALVDDIHVPDRGDSYGEDVWTRLRWKLSSERRRSTWTTIAAIAATIAVAFIGGILWKARTQPTSRPVATVAHRLTPPAVAPVSLDSARDHLLLVVVSDHLDSSERMLLELSNADAHHPLDVSAESRRAVDLVASNRIYRQTAARRGDTRIASLLSDLEPVLVELSHAGSALSPTEVAALQKRIDSKGLLFKVRVVSAQASGREVPVDAQPKGTDSL